MKCKTIVRTIISAVLLVWTGAQMPVAAQTGVKYPYVDATTDPTSGPIIVSKDDNGGIADGSIHENWTTTPAHNEENTTLNTVAAKLQVAKADQGATMEWVAAGTVCPDGWRLPTQRELMLIWVMGGATSTQYNAASATVQQRNPPLTSAPLYGVEGFIPLDASYYWSATETSFHTLRAWYVSFRNGDTSNRSKTNDSHRVRCVRDR